MNILKIKTLKSLDLLWVFNYCRISNRNFFLLLLIKVRMLYRLKGKTCDLQNIDFKKRK